MIIQEELNNLGRGTEAGLEQLLEGGREIFHQALAGSQGENGESACDLKVSTRGFLPSAEVIHQEQVRSEVLGQDNRVAFTGVKMRQTRVGGEHPLINLQPIGAMTDPGSDLGWGNLSLEFKEHGGWNDDASVQGL